jgi:hypothetical protein
MQKVSGVKEHCSICLRTERWGGSVILMDNLRGNNGNREIIKILPKFNIMAQNLYLRS